MTASPPAGNVTSIATMFPTVAANLGISPVALWLMFLGMTLLPIMAFKLPKIMYPLTILVVSLLGVSLDILPIWMLILAFSFTVLYFGKEAVAIFSSVTPSPSFETTTSRWVQTLYEGELPKPQSWNCKFCGGPNVQQVKCEWCGMVKE